jgi:hypothetical protein
VRLPRLKPGGAGKSLSREIAVVLALKLLVLCALWYAFFSQPATRGMTEGMPPERVAAAIAAVPADRSEPPTPEPNRGSP